jgi:hypothetical protein
MHAVLQRTTATTNLTARSKQKVAPSWIIMHEITEASPPRLNINMISYRRLQGINIWGRAKTIDIYPYFRENPKTAKQRLVHKMLSNRQEASMNNIRVSKMKYFSIIRYPYPFIKRKKKVFRYYYQIHNYWKKFSLSSANKGLSLAFWL